MKTILFFLVLGLMGGCSSIKPEPLRTNSKVWSDENLIKMEACAEAIRETAPVGTSQAAKNFVYQRCLVGMGATI